MRVAIVGCGLVGSQRAKVVWSSPDDELVVVADVEEGKARRLAHELGCEATRDWQEVVARDDIDVVVVSTPHRWLAPVTTAALNHGKHVLCEKPMGRNLAEALEMNEAGQAAGKQLKIGFNHRYYPAIRKAYELCSATEIGPLFFIRCIYGHGGRPGYEKEWRHDPALAGGGELLDQGVHVVDLCRWFLGEFIEVTGYTTAYYWKREDSSESRFQLEDNAFVVMRTDSGQAAFWHTTWTQWKNRFVFEIYGRDGYVQVEGRGGSYGRQQVTLGKRRAESGPPEEKVWEFPDLDVSWRTEWDDFAAAIREGRPPLGNAGDGLAAMRLVDAIYRSSRVGHRIAVDS